MDDMKIREALCSKGVLAVLNISVWQGNKLDHALSDAQSKAVKAGAAKAIRVHKTLLSDDRIKEPQRIAGEARRLHAELTLPWHYDGVGLLPAEMILGYTTKMDQLKVEFWRAVRAIEEGYGDMIQRAILDLGDAFRVEDYPRVSQLRDRYGWTSTFERLPTTATNDLRLSLPEEVVDLIEDKLNTEHKQVVQAVLERIDRVLSPAIARIRARAEDPTARVFDSTFERLTELPEMMQKLNITDDPEINHILASIGASAPTADEVRTNPETRDECLAGLTQIQNRLRNMGIGL